MTNEAYRYVLSVDGHDMELSDGEVTIGRSRTSTVRIDHESVSRSHALLTLDKGTAVVKDLNSSNGTYVGGRRVINETRLADGDQIQLGAAVIAYRILSTTRSERTALIDTEMGSAGPPPPAAAGVRADASPAMPVSDSTAGSETQVPDGDATDSDPAAPEPVAPPPLEISAPPKPQPPPPQPPAPQAPTLASVPIHGRSPQVPHPAATLRGGEPAAGFFARLLALLVDGVVLTAVNIVLFSPVFLILFFRGELQLREAGSDAALLFVTLLCALLMIAANLWYTVGGWAKNGRTPGKSLLHIAVVVPGRPAGAGIGWKSALLRAFGTLLSTLLLGLGFLVALVRRDRRALHDLIAGTRVVRLE